MRKPIAAAVSPVALLLALLASVAFAADAQVKEWKRDWDQAQAIGDREKRADAEVKALDHLKDGGVEAAQAAVSVAIDANAHWKTHDAAIALLRGMSAEPVKAWAAKEVTASKDARVRAVLCSVVSDWKPLLAALKDKESSVVSAAAESLSHVKEKEVVGALVAALSAAKEPRTQDDLSRALSALTGQKHHDPSEWESWWKQEGARFSFDAGAAPPPPEAPSEGGVPKTTSNGSGLYETISSNKVIFVIDVSYSMRITGEVETDAPKTGGAPAPAKKTLSRLEYVQKELCAAIEAQLSKKCLFNIIAFSTKVTPWKAKLVEASDGNKKAAKAWVMALQPDAETNTYDALELAFQDKQVDTIYLLTDGFPTHGKYVLMDAIRGEVRKWNDVRHVRLHTICYVVGDGRKFSVIEDKEMSKNFMKALAQENGGTCKVFE